MAWIESHQTLGSHLKLLRFARKLGVHRAQAIGHLHYLWWWALDGAPSGDLSTLQDEELAELAQWPNDPGLFATALRECGWLDEDGTLHDWREYVGRILTYREANRKRQRKYRKNTRNGYVTRDITVTSRARNGARSQLHNGDVTPLPYSTVPNRTVPDSTEPVCVHTPSAQAQATHTQKEQSVSQSSSREIPNIEAVLLHADRIGLAEWKARDWFNEMEGCGWQDYAGRDIRRWEAVLQRVAVKWQADGSPSSPPSRRTDGNQKPYEPIDHSKGFFS